MKKLIAIFLGLFCLPLATAANNGTETDRVKDAGIVLKEILDIPDDIPRDLLDRAECVIVLPSVKKGAIGIGGSYGRGAMSAGAANTSPVVGDRRRCTHLMA